MNDIRDKRRFFRLEKETPISVQECDIYEELNLTGSKQRKLPHYANLKNISACGVLIRTCRLFSIGTIVKLEISLEGFIEKQQLTFEIFKDIISPKINTPFKTIAKVVRIEALGQEEYEIGFEFIGVEETQKEALVQYILNNVPFRKHKEESEDNKK